MRARKRFSCSLESIAGARRFVATALADAGRNEVVEPARLVVSELATNAIKHAGSGFDVEIDIGPIVRLAVYDEQPGDVLPLALDGISLSGRGLRIVAALADRWGVEAVGAGKRVWWEVGN